MYRFLLRPKWIAFHLLVLFGIVVMVNLAFWQLRRLDARQDFNDHVRISGAAPVVAIDDVLPSGGDTILDAATVAELEWRTVGAAGEYLPDEELHVINRSQDGIAGDVILTPLVLDDGRILLVERGFVRLDEPVGAAPDGPVEVVGRLRASATRATGQLSDADETDNLVPRVDIPALAERFDAEVVPMYVELTDQQPLGADAPAPVAAPVLSDGPHLSYAVQWFIFSLCVVVGWVLAVRRSIATRRKELAT